MKKVISVGAALAFLIAASAANAHDFFLMPDNFRGPGGHIKVQATVGSNFPKAENTVAADRVDRLITLGAGMPRARIAGATATSLGVEITGAGNGLLMVAVSTKPRDVDYAEDRIPLILEEYRVLPDAVAAVDRLARPRTWRVTSRRYAKTFVCVRICATNSAGERPTGALLEFVSQNAKFTHFRLLALGKPVATYPIDVVGQDGKRQHLTTDARGDVRLDSLPSGTTMLFAAKLQKPVGAERFMLDLTSLTFEK